MKGQKNWIANAINPKHKGALRKKLKVKKGDDIPMEKLEKAEKSKNKTTARQARLAETLKRMKK